MCVWTGGCADVALLMWRSSGCWATECRLIPPPINLTLMQVAGVIVGARNASHVGDLDRVFSFELDAGRWQERVWGWVGGRVFQLECHAVSMGACLPAPKLLTLTHPPTRPHLLPPMQPTTLRSTRCWRRASSPAETATPGRGRYWWNRLLRVEWCWLELGAGCLRGGCGAGPRHQQHALAPPHPQQHALPHACTPPDLPALRTRLQGRQVLERQVLESGLGGRRKEDAGLPAKAR